MAQPAKRPTSRGAGRLTNPTFSPPRNLADHDHHLMSEDIVYLILPRVASPDTITTQREEVGNSLTPVGPAVGSDT